MELKTTAQAAKQGVSSLTPSRLVGKSILTRVRSGIYASEGIPWTELTEIRTQWITLNLAIMASDRIGDEVMRIVFHESAAEIHQIGDLDNFLIHFTV
ncbi:MAG: type IV toxin-antitoxin system AbiEi family antitoxin domain-containing protein [Corynebacterium sp.]|nr:type IV toxin-antitoxin system AbiEi family antitoxin domain-containing protein [Corynebacterium sp.]